MNEENKNEFENQTTDAENEQTAASEPVVSDNPEETTSPEENAPSEEVSESENTVPEADDAAAVAADEAEELSDGADMPNNTPVDGEPEEVIITDGDPTDWATAVPVPQRASKQGIIALIAAAAVIILAIALVIVLIVNRNPYNKKYVDVTGRTIEEVAKGAGYELSEFLEVYGLPADMPANTHESAAYYSIPAGTMAQMNMIDFATLKQILGLGDDITEQTTWGEVEDSLTLRQQVGEDGLEEFKEKYGFGDNVTLDTKWGEIRKRVDSADRKSRIAEEKEAKKAEKKSSGNDEGGDVIGGADAPTDIVVGNDGAAASADGGSEPVVVEGTVTEDGIVMDNAE